VSRVHRVGFPCDAVICTVNIEGEGRVGFGGFVGVGFGPVVTSGFVLGMSHTNRGLRCAKQLAVSQGKERQKHTAVHQVGL